MAAELEILGLDVTRHVVDGYAALPRRARRHPQPRPPPAAQPLRAAGRRRQGRHPDPADPLGAPGRLPHPRRRHRPGRRDVLRGRPGPLRPHRLRLLAPARARRPAPHRPPRRLGARHRCLGAHRRCTACWRTRTAPRPCSTTSPSSPGRPRPRAPTGRAGPGAQQRLPAVAVRRRPAGRRRPPAVVPRRCGTAARAARDEPRRALGFWSMSASERRAAPRTAVVWDVLDPLLAGPRRRRSTSSTSAAAPAAPPSGSPASATGSPSSTPAPTRSPRSTAAPASAGSRSPDARATCPTCLDLVGPAAVDLVLCHGVLEVVDDPAAALAAIRQVLRPGGHLSAARRPAPRRRRRPRHGRPLRPGRRRCSTTPTAHGSAPAAASPATRPPTCSPTPASRSSRPTASASSPTSCPARSSTSSPARPPPSSSSSAPSPAVPSTSRSPPRCTCSPPDQCVGPTGCLDDRHPDPARRHGRVLRLRAAARPPRAPGPAGHRRRRPPRRRARRQLPGARVRRPLGDDRHPRASPVPARRGAAARLRPLQHRVALGDGGVPTVDAAGRGDLARRGVPRRLAAACAALGDPVAIGEDSARPSTTSSASPARSVSPPRSRWPSSPAAAPSPTACSSCRPRRSPRSCTRSTSASSTAWGRRPRRLLHRLGLVTVGDVAHTPVAHPAARGRPAPRRPPARPRVGRATGARSRPAAAARSATAHGDADPTSRWAPRRPSAATPTTATVVLREVLRLTAKVAARLRAAGVAGPHGHPHRPVRRLHHDHPQPHPGRGDRRHPGGLRRRRRPLRRARPCSAPGSGWSASGSRACVPRERVQRQGRPGRARARLVGGRPGRRPRHPTLRHGRRATGQPARRSREPDCSENFRIPPTVTPTTCLYLT